MQEVSKDPVTLSRGSWFPPLLPTSTFEVARASSLPSLTQHQSLRAVSGVCVGGGEVTGQGCSGDPPPKSGNLLIQVLLLCGHKLRVETTTNQKCSGKVKRRRHLSYHLPESFSLAYILAEQRVHHQEGP